MTLNPNFTTNFAMDILIALCRQGEKVRISYIEPMKQQVQWFKSSFMFCNIIHLPILPF